ncbi:hypothetical protein BD408DRAFT_356292, partial [Parasitella parasitica]
SLKNCHTVEDLDTTLSIHIQHRSSIRNFYYGNSNAKRSRRLELTKSTFYDTIASKERRFMGAQQSFMYIGDRGHKFGSAIKVYQRFGELWEEKRHARYTSPVITNEHNLTCLFCFSKLAHSIFSNKISTMAIGLADLAMTLFGVTFPCFDSVRTTTKSSMFSKTARNFLNGKHRSKGSLVDDGNTL